MRIRILLICCLLLTSFCEQIRYRSRFVSNTWDKSNLNSNYRSGNRNHYKLRVNARHKNKVHVILYNKNRHKYRAAPVEPVMNTSLKSA